MCFRPFKSSENKNTGHSTTFTATYLIFVKLVETSLVLFFFCFVVFVLFFFFVFLFFVFFS